MSRMYVDRELRLLGLWVADELMVLRNLNEKAMVLLSKKRVEKTAHWKPAETKGKTSLNSFESRVPQQTERCRGGGAGDYEGTKLVLNGAAGAVQAIRNAFIGATWHDQRVERGTHGQMA